MTQQFATVALASIIVDRDDRQRRQIEVEDLKQSLAKRGLINPLVVTRDHKLIAGERRLTAARELEWPEIAVRYLDELSLIELQLIELEENVKRKDLDWKDECLAVLRVHQLYLEKDPEWTLGETANELCMSLSGVSQKIRVANELTNGNERVVVADGERQAYNLLTRKDSREAAKELESLLSVKPLPNGAAATQPIGVVKSNEASPEPTPLASPKEILNQSFLEWAPLYQGEKFNLIHCDFPYGIDVFSGPQSTGGTDITYEDSKDVYFELLECFCNNLDNFTSLSAHIVFWFSMRHYESTLALFRNKAPSIEWFHHPLIWGKSDNAGIAGDHRRHPRHTYECALFGSRGKRQIVKIKGDFYAAPTDRQFHASAKPVPVLKHFFEMLVDEHTALLDPTCGAGSALRAADDLGAPRILGLEIDPQHASTAQTLLNNSRQLRNASRKAGE